MASFLSHAAAVNLGHAYGGLVTDAAIGKLQELISIPTVSHPDPSQRDHAPFIEFIEAFERNFPRLTATLERVGLPEYALLYRWAGRSSERPVVLMAHIDVVPIDETAPWQHPPFGAEVHDGAIWGRGTLDDKGQLVAISEAVEQLLQAGFVPEQDIWLSFGSTEEVSGETAALAVEALRDRGVKPWFVMDEGGAIAAEAFPGIVAPLGVLGVTEKGITSLELVVEGRGGHASTPSKMDATARLARAILRLDKSPFPSRLPAPTAELFRRLAPHAPAPLRPVMANAQRIEPVLARALTLAGPEAAAMTRTTAAVTTLSGSPAINVIASSARAGVNLRIMVGDTVEQVIARVRKIVNDDKVRIDVLDASEPSPVSPYDDAAFALIESTIANSFPDAIPTPYVMMAATDSRFYTEICDRVYRFAPFRMSKSQREAIHSYDEHLGIPDFLDGIAFYRSLMEGIA